MQCFILWRKVILTIMIPKKIGCILLPIYEYNVHIESILFNNLIIFYSFMAKYSYRRSNTAIYEFISRLQEILFIYQ